MSCSDNGYGDKDGDYLTRCDMTFILALISRLFSIARRCRYSDNNMRVRGIQGLNFHPWFMQRFVQCVQFGCFVFASRF